MPVDMIRTATEADWPEIESLLVEHGLPLAGAREALGSFHIFDRNGRAEACAALEPYGDAWLLRSVAVRENLRGSGIGTRLVRHLLGSVGSDHPVMLVTTTAAGWFQGFGFRPVEDDEVPLAVKESVEFRGACPSGATVMKREGP